MHRPVLRRGTAVTGAALALLLLLPTAASAHGVDGAAGRSVPEFVWLGITHMLLGWDHLRFVAGVALVAGTARRATVHVSLFALGHSVTLITAAITEWRVSPTKVDLVIGLSVVLGILAAVLVVVDRAGRAGPAVASGPRTAFDLPAPQQLTKAWFAGSRSKVAA